MAGERSCPVEATPIVLARLECAVIYVSRTVFSRIAGRTRTEIAVGADGARTPVQAGIGFAWID